MLPLALWAKSVTWGTPPPVSLLPSLFSPLMSFLCFLLSISFIGFSFSQFFSLPPLTESVLLPLSGFLFPVSLPSTTFLSFSLFSLPPFLFLSFFSSLPLISPVTCPLPPLLVSFIHHFCSISIERGARGSSSGFRQESPNFPPEPNLYPKCHVFLPSFSQLGTGKLLWEVWGYPLFPSG